MLADGAGAEAVGDAEVEDIERVLEGETPAEVDVAPEDVAVGPAGTLAPAQPTTTRLNHTSARVTILRRYPAANGLVWCDSAAASRRSSWRRGRGWRWRRAELADAGEVARRTTIKPVHIDAHIDEMLALALAQNFVPVIDDRAVFIGIVRRSTILRYFQSRIRATMPSLDKA